MRAELPPGPPGDVLINNFVPQASPLALMMKLAEFGDISTFRLAGRRMYFVNHPDVIRQIYTSRDWVRTRLSRDMLASFLGEGLFSQEAELHLQQRRLLQPAFHLKRVESYVAGMAERAGRMLGRWEDGQTRDVGQDMTRLTFEIVSKALFDADTGEQARQVAEAFDVIMRAVDREYPLYTLLPRWVPIRRWGKSRRALATLVRIADAIIKERRATEVDRGDLLSMLLVAQDEDGTRMTDAQVRGQTLSLLFAGHETTANLLSWTWYLLAKHPEVRAKLFAEVDAVLAGRPPELMDLKRLKYTEMVVKETLRMYPPAWYAERSPLQDTELLGYRIPAGATVAISVYAAHRDPRFFAQPERFMPERFDGVEDRQMPAYLPFGLGSHQCIGNRFAQMEAQLLVAAIAGRYSLELAPGAEVKPRELVTLGVQGLTMTVHRRA